MITGTLQESGALPRTMVWAIPDFFQLPQHVGFTAYSKEWNFMHMKCKLAVQPHGSNSFPNIMNIALHGISKEGFIRWELEIRRGNDTLMRNCAGSNEDADEMGVSMYVPVKDVEKGCSAHGFVKIVCRLYSADAASYYAADNENSIILQTEGVQGTDRLSYDLEELMLREDYSDLTIKAGHREFKVHRAIFGVRTPVLMNMFKHQVSKDVADVVVIDDCDAVIFREYQRFLYASRLSIFSPKVLFPLHQLADKYQSSDLKTYCLEQTKAYMSADNFCDSAALCFQYPVERFTDIVVQYLAENISEIKKSEEWKNFEFEDLEKAEELMQKAVKYKDLTSSKENFLQKLIKTIRGTKKL